MLRRHELTDDQWEKVEGLLPGRKRDAGGIAEDKRLFVNAALFVARTGIPWRDLPSRLGKWNNTWRRFDRWCASYVWQRLLVIVGEPDLTWLAPSPGQAGDEPRAPPALLEKPSAQHVITDARYDNDVIREHVRYGNR